MAKIPELRKREDFVGALPVPSVKKYIKELPDPEPFEVNPDWTPWDYRRVEKTSGLS
jgi:hypothetical protein